MSKYRIQRLNTTVAVAHGAVAIFNSAATYAANGVLYAVKSKIASNTDASATYTVAIVDADGDVVYSKAGISGTAGTVYTQLTGDQRAGLADGTFTIRITFSANQTATDNTVTVSLMIDRG
jgi:hypothetical protein